MIITSKGPIPHPKMTHFFLNVFFVLKHHDAPQYYYHNFIAALMGTRLLLETAQG